MEKTFSKQYFAKIVLNHLNTYKYTNSDLLDYIRNDLFNNGKPFIDNRYKANDALENFYKDPYFKANNKYIPDEKHGLIAAMKLVDNYEKHNNFDDYHTDLTDPVKISTVASFILGTEFVNRLLIDVNLNPLDYATKKNIDKLKTQLKLMLK